MSLEIADEAALRALERRAESFAWTRDVVSAAAPACRLQSVSMRWSPLWMTPVCSLRTVPRWPNNL